MTRGVWMRTTPKGRAHLTWDCGGGYRESACGITRHRALWRDKGDAKMCARCFQAAGLTDRVEGLP